MRIEDHVGRQGDGGQAHQRRQAQSLNVDVAERNTHRDEDDRELADLRDGQPGEKTSSFAVAHAADDRHDDHRVTDEDEDRQHDRRPDLSTQGRKFQFGPQIEEEKQQQKVADAGNTSRDGVAVGG